MAGQTKEEKQAEAEAEALEAIKAVHTADKEQQVAAAAAGLPSIPADHITIGYIPDEGDPVAPAGKAKS